MIEEIRRAVHNASLNNQKMAMFHFQVLKHASELDSLDPIAFCHDIDVTESYQTEFRKMLNLARIMRQEGVHLA